MSSGQGRRVTLTKAQLQAESGAELLALCQALTEDGRLTDIEIGQLSQWLSSHRDSDLPAIDFLVKTVEQILADEVVTPSERRELYRAIERVLPSEARHLAVEKRRESVAAEREKELAARPLESVDFMTAGVRYEDRAEVVRQFVRAGQVVFLVRDRQNSHSRNAIEVRAFNGRQIGFVPEDDAIRLAPLLDQGSLVKATVKKTLTGTYSPIPVIVASIYHPGAKVEGAFTEADAPPKPAGKLTTQRASTGCCLRSAALVVLGLGGALAVVLL